MWCFLVNPKVPDFRAFRPATRTEFCSVNPPPVFVCLSPCVLIIGCSWGYKDVMEEFIFILQMSWKYGQVTGSLNLGRSQQVPSTHGV